jgi:hypothetical protein
MFQNERVLDVVFLSARATRLAASTMRLGRAWADLSNLRKQPQHT